MEKKWEVGVNLQRCKQGHGFYSANSPEYPCPYCAKEGLEIHIKELEERIELAEVMIKELENP